jgi:hypothetical protein
MAVIMINSLANSSSAYGSSNYPYNAPVSRPTNNSAIQPSAKLNSTGEQSSEFHPSMSIPELENKANKAVQNTLDDKVNDVASQKDAIWQLQVGQSYVETQKQALNAYVTSATGEPAYESGDDKQSLTDIYMAHVELEMKLRNPEISKPEQPIAPEDDFSIQPVEQLTRQLAQQQAMAQYGEIQNQGRTSLLHMSA